MAKQALNKKLADKMAARGHVDRAATLIGAGSFSTLEEPSLAELEGAAQLLVDQFDKQKDKPAGAKPVPDHLLRAFTMDLMVEHFPPNSPMVELLRRALKVSNDYKPHAWRIAAGKPRGQDNRGNPKRAARTKAMKLDEKHLCDHGEFMSQIKLAEKVKVNRRTIGKWRAEVGWPQPGASGP